MTASILGFLSVAIGAFAAHGLKSKLSEYHLGIFQTGVQYQFYHTFALAIVGLLMLRSPTPMLRGSGIAFFVGILVFSGSLYLLALTKMKWLGAITPIGGLCFLVGWVLLSIAVCRSV